MSAVEWGNTFGHVLVMLPVVALWYLVGRRDGKRAAQAEHWRELAELQSRHSTPGTRDLLRSYYGVK